MLFIKCLNCKKNSDKKEKYKKQDEDNIIKNPNLSINDKNESLKINDQPIIQIHSDGLSKSSNDDYDTICNDDDVTQQQQQGKKNSEYELPNDNYNSSIVNENKIQSTNAIKEINPIDIYSYPNPKSIEASITNDDDDTLYDIKVPVKNFDATYIYDKNNNNKYISTTDSDHYYYYHSTGSGNGVNLNNNSNINENIYHVNKSSHYEVLPDYDYITQMTNDNNNITRFNINSNQSNLNNIRNIIVNDNLLTFDENPYSHIESSTINNNNNNNNNSIQYMDVNIPTINYINNNNNHINNIETVNPSIQVQNLSTIQIYNTNGETIIKL